MYRKIELDLKHLKHNYMIDTLGVVTNVDNGKILKGTSITKNNRYKKVHLDKFYALHRLVAKHFIPNPNNYPQVNHIDGDRHNNTAANLEWCTASQNVKHAFKIGIKNTSGANHPRSILTEKDVKAIWALRGTELTARQIRDRLKLPVSIDCVKVIRSGKNWSSVTDNLK